MARQTLLPPNHTQLEEAFDLSGARIDELAVDVQKLVRPTDAADAAQAAEAVLASGPVTSVNGRQGSVVLGMSDIAGLVSALAAKAESSHGHTIAQISNLQVTLDAITDGGSY